MAPACLAAAATGAGGGPAVVLPSVNMTMIWPLEEDGSKSEAAVEKAAAWLVVPPADSPWTAAFRSETEVIRLVSAVAELEKLVMAIRLPEPMPAPPPVDWAMMSMKVSAPSFMLASGTPAILPDRSSTSTISTGFSTILGAAERPNCTPSWPPQRISCWSMILLELVMPILMPPFQGIGNFAFLYGMRHQKN